MKELDCKAAIARLASQYCDGRLSRRDFLRRCATLGIGFSAAASAALLSPRPWHRVLSAAEAQPAASARVAMSLAGESIGVAAVLG